MKRRLLIFALLLASAICRSATPERDTCIVENKFLARSFSWSDGTLRTVRIVNKLSGADVAIEASPEFRLRISQGTNRPSSVVTLTSSDFRVVTNIQAKTGGPVFVLTNADYRLGIKVSYGLAEGQFFMRKRLEIVSEKMLTLERVDVEALTLADAWQPYARREITANMPGHWNPGLGQPLYTTNNAMFWGVEFPAADNQVREGLLCAGYRWGRAIQPGEVYRTYDAVMGVADNAAFLQDAFFDYIDQIRARPFHLQIQYNSWFDHGSRIDQEKFAASVRTVNQELVVARGNPPLAAYVIDDGWEDTKADWSDKVWKVNNKFDPQFAPSLATVAAAQSRLGLWVSPGCLFGAHPQVAALRAQGFEALDDWMSMAGPRYMQALEDRLLELNREGVHFYKLDGLFGHLNLRNFDLRGDRYGLSTIPPVDTRDFTAGDSRLNDSRYDELKIYYLTAGTERLMQIFRALGKADPQVYIVISNGAYLSPWWLMYVDAVWMINAGDAAKGGSRTDELVYRDGRYHDIWRVGNTQFPLCSVFNHEPKKTTSAESADTFRQYLFMSLSRGTGFIELYLKPSALKAADWDVLSDGLRWARETFPAFRRARMFGGDPMAGAVYGYTGWDATRGYLSIHNPGAKPQAYVVKLDRAFGVPPGAGPFRLSAALAGSTSGLPAECRSGDSLEFTLSPREIRVINFRSISAR